MAINPSWKKRKGEGVWGAHSPSARPPFGPSDIPGVQEGMECGGDPGASYVWVVCGDWMTPQERAGLGWRGEQTSLAKRGPYPDRRGRWEGLGLGWPRWMGWSSLVGSEPETEIEMERAGWGE